MFIDLAKDSSNWSGTPMFQGTQKQKGNLTDLKKRGLIETWVEDDGCIFVKFKPEGISYAATIGLLIEVE